MGTLRLSGGAYTNRSFIAAAQRCLNLIQEPIPAAEGEPSEFVHLPTPGLTLLTTLPDQPVRGLRQTLGKIFAVAGGSVFFINDWKNATLLGNIPTQSTPVSMDDNGLDMVIVDGGNVGWQVNLATNAFQQIVDPTNSFRGGDRVDYLDTFFLFNVPNTPQFESSLSLQVAFDPLYFANKETYADLLVTLIVAKRQIFLIGTRTTEIWYNSGSADFPFQQQPATFIDQGTCAKYSAAEVDNSAFWLSQDRRGRGMVLRTDGYDAKRISTFAMEDEIQRYADITDAVGLTYQIGGHIIYALSFPSADKTWAYDTTTGLWHEWAWIDANGVEHRHRSLCAFNINGAPVVGDWQNGNVYLLDPSNSTDNGMPIKRQRSFPHTPKNLKRMMYRQFIADMQPALSPP